MSERRGPDSARLDLVVRRSMAKDSKARFASAGDLGRAAIAAAQGKAAPEAERSVATGRAASEAETVAGATERVGPPTEPTARRLRKPRRRRRWIAAAVAVLVIGVGVLAAIEVPDRLDDGSGSGNPGVEVPDLAGKRLDLAQQQLRRLGLRSETEGGGVFGVVVPENWEVCASAPSAGDDIRPRSAVRLVVERPGGCD